MKGYLNGAMTGLVLVMAAPSPALTSLEYAQAVAAEEGSMGKLQLILKKLRDSMASMKDLDELEKAGMSKQDVDRMRRALRKKIDQLTNDAVEAIQVL